MDRTFLWDNDCRWGIFAPTPVHIFISGMEGNALRLLTGLCIVVCTFRFGKICLVVLSAASSHSDVHGSRTPEYKRRGMIAVRRNFEIMIRPPHLYSGVLWIHGICHSGTGKQEQTTFTIRKRQGNTQDYARPCTFSYLLSTLGRRVPR